MVGAKLTPMATRGTDPEIVIEERKLWKRLLDGEGRWQVVRYPQSAREVLAGPYPKKAQAEVALQMIKATT